MNDKKNSDFPIPDIITIESAKKIFLFCDGNYYKIREFLGDRYELLGEHNAHNPVIDSHGNLIVDCHIKMDVKHRLIFKLYRAEPFSSG